jgi:RNA polymerase-binding protein DksA
MNATGIDIDHFRELLTAERARAQLALEHLHSDNASSIEEQRDEIQSDNHLGDMATAMLDREIDYGIEENVVHALEAIDAALGRIDDGTFGICERCGKPIGLERLEALPYVTLCIDDKRLEERG